MPGVASRTGMLRTLYLCANLRLSARSSSAPRSSLQTHVVRSVDVCSSPQTSFNTHIVHTCFFCQRGFAQTGVALR